MENSIDNIISKDLIKLDLNAKSKQEVIGWIVDAARGKDYLNDITEFKKSVMSREEGMPTAIGYSVAIPHGKDNSVQKPFVGFVRTNEEFVWTENYEEKVQLVFLIGVPVENENNIHLKFISLLSKKLLDEEFRDSLLSSDDLNEVYDILNS
ncbi:PTS sugar transporter subunit IIA [Alkalibacterium olivapovliticus]|uniref:PTS system fructose-specific IIA component n=1 Tax=Alkalibacterium olivapovliticus TaxID=99907 RepID=A0A2T0W6R2_9LACT|nr:fructose PTS transporter subunit IIA [Alkalibacterium olivapovliticus]PRY82382.1 PTS system fructose-specific IIA component [Alkalibacterium olivapovliticus]